MKVKGTKKKVKIFDDLKQALSDALDYERGKKTGLRVSQLPPPPKLLTPGQIRAIRQSFNVSQAGFARIINVSVNAVESWERSKASPRSDLEAALRRRQTSGGSSRKRVGRPGLAYLIKYATRLSSLL